MKNHELLCKWLKFYGLSVEASLFCFLQSFMDREKLIDEDTSTVMVILLELCALSLLQE